MENTLSEAGFARFRDSQDCSSRRLPMETDSHTLPKYLFNLHETAPTGFAGFYAETLKTSNADSR